MMLLLSFEVVYKVMKWFLVFVVFSTLRGQPFYSIVNPNYPFINTLVINM